MAAEPQPIPAADFSALRAEGIALLQRYAGETWTDHNAHDPGITILEQLCYTLTDLVYRAGYDLPDLLAGDGQDPYASLHGPAEVLTGGAVTVDDLRRVVIDVPGVRNAWIDLVDEPAASHDAAHDAEISHPAPAKARTDAAAPSPNVSEIRLKGLYRVRIEMSDLAGRGGGAILRDAAERLHKARALGQDYSEIVVLDSQPVALGARLEIGAVADPVALLAEVYRRIDAYLSPAVPLRTLREMLERGKRLDQIFEGPLLEYGFIDPKELAAVERRTSLRISDLIRELTAVPGIAAVKSLYFRAADGKVRDDWVLDIDPKNTPLFNPQGSDIRLEKGSLRVDEGIRDQALALFTKHATEAARPRAKAAAEVAALRPPPGRDRKVAAYYPVQQQFPMTYGIGAAGLPASASPQRKAHAKQLKAYLMFFDQILANEFAQLASAARLLSFHDESSDSYFSQPVPDDGTLGLDAIRKSGPGEHRDNLRKWTEGARPGVERRNRFLDHLLARFGEQFREYALVQLGADAAGGMTPEERLADDKRAFLRDYPRIGRARGNGLNCLAPAGASENYSGLELTLRRRLGVRSPEEQFYLVEHILLRPLKGDAHQGGPLLRKALSRDPYSLQLTFVFPDWPERYQGSFRDYVARAVREETPAHLTAHIVWKDREAMDAFATAYAVWLAELRSHRLAALGIADG